MDPVWFLFVSVAFASLSTMDGNYLEEFDESTLGDDTTPFENEEMDVSDSLNNVFDKGDEGELEGTNRSAESMRDSAIQEAAEGDEKATQQTSSSGGKKKGGGHVKGAKEWSELKKNLFLIIVKSKYPILKQVKKKKPDLARNFQ